MLGYDAAQQDTQSHADVPRDEDGGVGRSALVMASYVDHHVLESRPHVTVAQSDEDGGGVVTYVSEE